MMLWREDGWVSLKGRNTMASSIVGQKNSVIFAETFKIPFASMSKETSICGTPLGAAGMPSRLNCPRDLLSLTIGRSPCKTCIVTAVWLFSAVEKATDGDATYVDLLQKVKEVHNQLIEGIIPVAARESLNKQMDNYFLELSNMLKGVFLLKDSTFKSTCSIVAYGELLASTMVSYYLDAKWLDVGTKENFINANNFFTFSKIVVPEIFVASIPISISPDDYFLPVEPNKNKSVFKFNSGKNGLINKFLIAFTV